MSFNHEYAQANGIELHYVREGSEFPLFLVHGWPEFWRAWRKNVPVLAESFDIIVPDLRGFGDSEKPDVPAEEGYGVDAHVEDMLALADELEIDEFGFVSHDLGAYVGQEIARQHPDVLRGLFLFDTPYPGIGERWRDPEHIDEIWYQSFNQQPWAADLVGSSREACEAYIGHFLDHWAGDPSAFGEEDRQAWVDTYLQEGNLQGGFNWYIAADDARKELMREGAPEMDPIEVPTRILWGELDPIVNAEWADRIGEYFADYELDTVPSAGHFLHHEKPEQANAEIESFFEGLD
ncbi:alpha/beta fold hydrolase [Natronosalvus rutilus]|uniref:Alpha/beta hydrolase n=1 Tax=Natronosalvus rutilus TaxID=2953753 RepID=A0A9E7NF72_9EURY|nr:alpha/beta hydrolase [Natronosalvus rutilus]UTF55743.1 alpha/beta hydrolase [Natronosalvus rutilus]